MKQVAFRETPFHTGWSADEEIHRKPRRHCAANFEPLIDLVPCGHDDQDIDVAVGVRRAVSVRAEQDDFVGLEALGNLAREAADHAHGNVGPAIPAGGSSIGIGLAFALHPIILLAAVGLLPREILTKTKKGPDGRASFCPLVFGL